MQQFSFIDLFESAVHVSGDKLAHVQEHFWLYVQLWYNAPVLLSTGDKVEMELKLATGRQQYRYIVPKGVYTVKNAPEDGGVCRPKHEQLIQLDQ